MRFVVFGISLPAQSGGSEAGQTVQVLHIVRSRALGIAIMLEFRNCETTVISFDKQRKLRDFNGVLRISKHLQL